jgi:hypothetical protein
MIRLLTRRIYTHFMQEDGYVASILAIIGAATSVGASAYGASQTGGGGNPISGNDILGQQQARPLGASGTLGALSTQQLFELGVPMGLIEDDLLARTISNNKNDKVARGTIALLNRARSAAANGDQALAQHYVNQANRNAGLAGANISLVNGQVQVNFQGAEAQIVAQLREADAGRQGMFKNRLTALSNLNKGAAGIAVPTAEEIKAAEAKQVDYLNRQLDTALTLKRQQITEAANAGGYSPSGELAQLSTYETTRRANITDTEALSRALALTGVTTDVQSRAIDAIKKALQPTFGNALGAAETQNSTDSSNSMQLALALATANAEASAARNVSQANAYSQLGTNALKAGLGAANIYQNSQG